MNQVQVHRVKSERREHAENFFLGWGVIILVVAGIYSTVTSETFQKTLFPKYYWQKELKTAQDGLEFAQGFIEELEHEQKMVPMVYRQEILLMMSSGLTEAEAKEIVESEKEKIAGLQSMIDTFSPGLTEYPIRIQKAQRQLLLLSDGRPFQ